MTPILMTIFASFCWALAAVMQKHGMTQNFPKISLKTLLTQFGTILKTLGTNWLWMLGIVIGLSGGGVYVQAVSMGDLSVLLPLVNLNMVFTIVLGVIFLNERLSTAEWIAVLIMIVGAFVISISGAEETSVNPPAMSLYLFIGSIVLALVFLFGGYFLTGKKIPIEVVLAMSAGTLFGVCNMLAKVLTFIAEENLGAFNILELETWKVAVLTMPMLILFIAQIVAFIFLQVAFSHGRVSLANPISIIFSVIVPVFAGLVLFQEQVSTLRWIGIAIILAGTALLAFNKVEESPEQKVA